jgi:hypothetical protein
MPRAITLVRKETIMREVTYTSAEDHLLHGALLLLSSMLEAVVKDEVHGKIVYDNNIEIMNEALDFIKKHLEKYPRLS